MRALEHQALSDMASLTGTTVVYREVDGEPQMVVVCGECAEIKTIGLPEAMQAALNGFMGYHRDQRHRYPERQNSEQGGE